MKKNFILLLIISILMGTGAYSQVIDSTEMVKSQKRIESDLKDASKHQRKIDKSQKRINRQQKKINRQERRRERKMRSIQKEQKSMNN